MWGALGCSRVFSSYCRQCWRLAMAQEPWGIQDPMTGQLGRKDRGGRVWRGPQVAGGVTGWAGDAGGRTSRVQRAGSSLGALGVGCLGGARAGTSGPVQLSPHGGGVGAVAEDGDRLVTVPCGTGWGEASSRSGSH